ncbi:DoxX family protein [Lysinibacter cavernae]|uniref:Putative membrane protein YphA (DoxX/SURF4 family) n=1 Tax=Lysinibacter cavernae TaxID=1640652 RepID=A0A7X5R0H7_9MICO|nr:DoxX family protein [Lysinibacter cavernae]NIH53247.1 putative membrane protein YphA (DoxX/SURF4 family) [Lysinibacter cavernae]
MNIALWIAAGLLAAVYLMSGTLKATQPVEKLKKQMGWVEDFPPTFVKILGVLQILGAIGLILPLATGIAPILTPIAAACFVVVQILAIAVHIRRKEYSIAINVVLLLLALFVAAFRFASA